MASSRNTFHSKQIVVQDTQLLRRGDLDFKRTTHSRLRPKCLILGLRKKEEGWKLYNNLAETLLGIYTVPKHRRALCREGCFSLHFSSLTK